MIKYVLKMAGVMAMSLGILILLSEFIEDLDYFYKGVGGITVILLTIFGSTRLFFREG